MIERGGARVPNPNIEFRKEPLPEALDGARLANPTIEFQTTADKPIIVPRIWYHVPRVGDNVDFGPDGGGKVTSVTWTIHKVIITLE